MLSLIAVYIGAIAHRRLYWHTNLASHYENIQWNIKTPPYSTRCNGISGLVLSCKGQQFADDALIFSLKRMLYFLNWNKKKCIRIHLFINLFTILMSIPTAPSSFHLQTHHTRDYCNSSLDSPRWSKKSPAPTTPTALSFDTFSWIESHSSFRIYPNHSLILSLACLYHVWDKIVNLTLDGASHVVSEIVRIYFLFLRDSQDETSKNYLSLLRNICST